MPYTKKIAALLLAGMMLTGSGAMANNPDSDSACQSMPAAATEVWAQIDAQRRTAGISGLQQHEGLRRAAETQACYMVHSGQLGHLGAGGSAIKARVRAAGAKPCALAENVGQISGKVSVVRMWMESPLHRRNMLNQSYRTGG